MTAHALQTQDLAIGYRRRSAGDIMLARGLDLSLRKGKLVGLLGPNGVGKSTLLRTLARMQKPLAGRVLLGGKELATMKPLALARRLSLVLTVAPPPNLMNGYSLVALGRQPHSDWLGRLSAADHSAVNWALDAVGGADLADKPLAQLSDGQRQKLMIARALAQEADVMLLDEPTAYLDLPRRVETMQLLKELAHSAARAILVSTHDLDLALRSCDQLWLMSENSIITGAPEDLVLADGLGKTFRAASLAFDKRSGSFVLDPPRGPAVRVIGKGAPGIWMRRALERSGYQTSDEAGDIEVAHQAKGGGRWQLRINSSCSRQPSIQAVLDALESEMK